MQKTLIGALVFGALLVMHVVPVAADTETTNALSFKIAKGATEDGTIEREHNFYATFIRPGRNVSMDLFEKQNGKIVSSFVYDDARFRSPGQLGFAVGTTDLPPLTDYRYVLKGYDVETGKLLTVEGEFTTADYPPIGHTWNYEDDNKKLLERLGTVEKKLKNLEGTDALSAKVPLLRATITACIDQLSPVEVISKKVMDDCLAKGLPLQVIELEEARADLQVLTEVRGELPELKSLGTIIAKSAKALAFFAIDQKGIREKVSTRIAGITSIESVLKNGDIEAAQNIYDELDIVEKKEMRSTLSLLQKMYPDIKKVRNQKIKKLLFEAFEPIKEAISAGDWADAFDSLTLFNKEFQKNKKLFLSTKMNSTNQKKVVDLLKKLESILEVENEHANKTF